MSDVTEVHSKEPALSRQSGPIVVPGGRSHLGFFLIREANPPKVSAHGPGLVIASALGWVQPTITPSRMVGCTHPANPLAGAFTKSGPMSHHSFFAEATRRSGRHSSSPMAIDRLDRKSGDSRPNNGGRGKKTLRADHHRSPRRSWRHRGHRVEPAVASPPLPLPTRPGNLPRAVAKLSFFCNFLSPAPVATSGSKITNSRTRCISVSPFLRHPN